ncbi:hypothetical protein FV222_02245 [Methylobacterium sp. WL103]|uniref:hypothetical protein n=1 Tax=Methylobacterium sp. WL103 TaxID=2603891 RepID=UPI0011CA3F7F|nr:hypothetical protein [Methylobacterium sp. WL103]TXN07504.1 hypothetical protein FV222_02245 [Methylobacterium sp. WL103]
MSRNSADEQIVMVLTDLMRARLALDPQTFGALIGSILTEVDLGMQLAEELAMEAKFRRRSEGNVVAFPLPEQHCPR